MGIFENSFFALYYLPPIKNLLPPTLSQNIYLCIHHEDSLRAKILRDDCPLRECLILFLHIFCLHIHGNDGYLNICFWFFFYLLLTDCDLEFVKCLDQASHCRFVRANTMLVSPNVLVEAKNWCFSSFFLLCPTTTSTTSTTIYVYVTWIHTHTLWQNENFFVIKVGI